MCNNNNWRLCLFFLAITTLAVDVTSFAPNFQSSKCHLKSQQDLRCPGGTSESTSLYSHQLQEPPPTKEGVNGESMNVENTISQSSHTFTPQQIMYPQLASLWSNNPETKTVGIPFYQAIRALREALEKIATASPGELNSLLESLEIENDNSNSISVLRLEQTVSHTVDPLGWLYAQSKRQLTVPNNSNKKDPLFYIQSTVETAVFGSAWSWTERTQNRPDFWKFLAQLPHDSYLYGGERFDQNPNIQVMPSQQRQQKKYDWKDFGDSWWILPAMELREEPVEQVVHTSGSDSKKVTTLSVHLVVDGGSGSHGWQESARTTLQLLQRITDAVTDAQVPATTLPPVMTRESSYTRPDGETIDGQDLYERGVSAALEAFEDESNNDKSDGLKKVVLARRMDLQFQAEFSALDILRKWKYNDIHEGGNMFYMRPMGEEEFFGCTPERLFTIQKNSNVVLSEALAGTRPRGTSLAADEQLLRELFGSTKDREENSITADFIQNVFTQLGQMGLVETTQTIPSTSMVEDENQEGQSTSTSETTAIGISSSRSGYFVRRLRHLQHICQRFSAQLVTSGDSSMKEVSLVKVVQHLLANLHPTPAVCGFPADPAMEFIRKHESIGFDRGFYAGPVGYMGRSAADILVAIRSGLVSQSADQMTGDIFELDDSHSRGTKVSVYAGAGLVPGSTVQGEWAETSYKLGVISSLFPQSPLTLQSAPTPNVAWANAFIEELIRNGITQFYVCPGSRSTPLVVAIARAARSNVGVVNAVSVHDERGAGFRAVGYGRGTNKPAAIITSSGTAIANLYPAIVEAGMDGVPMLILTADRPYENRDTGANQAIDQVKAYSSSYIRWFRDILPPHDDVPVSVALADAGHAVSVSRSERGPVHVNIQFRENLAPDGGPIRNDNRADSLAKFNGFRFTDVPGFRRWSTGGDRWLRSYVMSGMVGNVADDRAVIEVARQILQSKRGIIVVGNIRGPTDENNMDQVTTTSDIIHNFAETIGFPIIAGAQNAHLRFSSTAVIPFAEHMLKNPTIAQNIKPDLILQIGSPLVSSEVPSMISAALKDDSSPARHVLLHPHHGSERADPEFTVSLKVSADVVPFLKGLTSHLDSQELCKQGCSSQLAPLVRLGKQLQSEMPNIINEASEIGASSQVDGSLTEPQVVLSLAMMMSNCVLDQSLFLSNSMPIRDAEFFLYPTKRRDNSSERGVISVGSNRGASGIDGIISSAIGFAESTAKPTTLLIGDLAALHDITSLHALKSGTNSAKHPLTTILVNNNGGGIFSFLPIAKHGTDVSFDDFFGTPTETFSYTQGSEAFGLAARSASRFDSLCKVFAEAVRSEESSIIEARVVGREENVAVHRRITDRTNFFIDSYLNEAPASRGERAPIKFYHAKAHPDLVNDREDLRKKKTLVLLHGWMGDKAEWDDAGTFLVKLFPTSEWDIISVDLPGHGASRLLLSSDNTSLRSALRLDPEATSNGFSIDAMAQSVLDSLARDHGVAEVNGIAGYSLGGRVALAMRRLCSSSSNNAQATTLITDDTKFVLLSSHPGDLPKADGKLKSKKSNADLLRMMSDDRLSRQLQATCDRTDLSMRATSEALWSDFLHNWYGMPMWGELTTKKETFQNMIEKRTRSLNYRGRDLAAVLRQSSPPRNSREDWRGLMPEQAFFLAGSLDAKYSELGTLLEKQGVKFVELPQMGHGLLVEDAKSVAEEISNFVLSKTKQKPSNVPSSNTMEHAIMETSQAKEPRNEPKFPESQGVSIGSIDFEPFTIPVFSENQQGKGVFGIGWGEQAKKSNQMTARSGFLVQLVSMDGSKVGVGEVSPLPGLHKESFEEAEEQLVALKDHFENDSNDLPTLSVTSALSLDGELSQYLKRLAAETGMEEFVSSVRSGLEMALISLASQAMQNPIHQALIDCTNTQTSTSSLNSLLPVNGLITRGASAQINKGRKFPSLKVKVGHQDVMDDASSVSRALQQIDIYRGPAAGAIRADANRAWDDGNAMQFATALESTDIRAMDRLEFVEEPIRKQEKTEWSIEDQVHALERWYAHTGISYALDESLADLAEKHNYDFASMRRDLKATFGDGSRGCAAFVLKPALVGLELSMQLARLARNDLGIGVSFSSSFDSGIGLAYTAILAAIADAEADTRKFAHGVGTFTMLDGDTLSPAFSSYVNEQGFLNVFSLSRALNGLGLDELKDSYAFFEFPAELASTGLPSSADDTTSSISSMEENAYEASTSTSSSGREINMVVSLSLPFSADIAVSRFTDFPQQSRWSPWIRSVRYLDDGRETEWTLNVRGVQFKWRAKSELLQPPLKGIQWESISGIKNKGTVEFVEVDENTSAMKVRMSIMTPRILATIFQSTSVFVEEFLQTKLLKWSLEMFRDVVKGDLALERGDVELGDALFSSVEGKASAIEATLSMPPKPDDDNQ